MVVTKPSFSRAYCILERGGGTTPCILVFTFLRSGVFGKVTASGFFYANSGTFTYPKDPDMS